MRVEIEHKEDKRGVLRKKIYQSVWVTVHFTPEQLETIKANDLADLIIMERDVPPTSAKDAHLFHEGAYNLTVKTLLGGKIDRYSCVSVAAAKQYEEQLLTQLRALKEYLEESSTPVEGTRSFEL